MVAVAMELAMLLASASAKAASVGTPVMHTARLGALATVSARKAAVCAELASRAQAALRWSNAATMGHLLPQAVAHATQVGEAQAAV
mmetsp:Transcript_12887/g.24315  ORF Transcript_12887/g.24315 Transcript_12887/m.24315 type:complete len:87 (+) Transcript_12887:1290-1550(+)